MSGASDATILWVIITAQLIGFTSVALTRLLERSNSRMAGQAIFFVSLLALGGITAVTLSNGSDVWLCSGATLPIMAVGATIDLQPHSSAPSV